MFGVVLFVFAVLAGCYFALLKPDIDAFSFAYGGLLFYFSPAFIDVGRGIGQSGSFPIGVHTQLLGVVLFIAIVVGDRTLPRFRIEFQDSVNSALGDAWRYHIHILFGVTTFFVFLMFSTAGIEAIGAPKASVPKLPFINRLLRLSLAITLVASALARHRTYLFIIAVYLFATLIVFQIRSTVAYSLAAVVLLYLREKNLNIPQRVRYGSIGAVGAILFILFDNVKGQLLHGNYSVLIRAKPYLDIYLNNNAQNFVHIFELTVGNNFRIQDPLLYTAGTIFASVPFNGTLFGISDPIYGTLIIREFLPWREAGIASNIWAESYAIGGVFGIGFLIICYLFLLSIISANLDSNTRIVQIWAYSLVGFFSAHILVLPISTLISMYIITTLIILGGTYTLAMLLSLLSNRAPRRYLVDR